jgi:Ca2+-binding RTX toxin-like protein
MSVDPFNDGIIETKSNVLVTGLLIPSGSFALYGSGFETLKNVSISRLTINAPGISLDIQGNLNEGGKLGINGSIKSASIVVNGLSAKITGDLRWGFNGTTSAINTTAEIISPNGFHLTTRTDASGKNVVYQAAFSGQNIDIFGSWADGQVSNWKDIFVGSDTFNGTAGNDFMTGLGGNDVLNGNAGVDTAVFSGKRADYTLVRNTNSATVTDKVTGRDGQDTLVSIERLEFTNGSLALDINGNAGQAYRIYQAAFNRTPDNSGLKYWIGLMDGGVSLPTVSSAFISSAEFKALYGANPINEVFISKLYNNVLHRAPDLGGYNYWVGLLNTNKIDKINSLIHFSESNENQAAVVGVIQDGIMLFS